MQNVSFIENDAQLTEVYKEIETRVAQAQRTHPVWPCKKGCDACCRRLAQPPEFTAVEWLRLYQGIQTLPNAIQDDIKEKVAALAHRDETEQSFVVCPLLDEEKGACHVYAHRPAACRMYGFYVSQHNNQWCQLIEDLFQAGDLEGAMLGNHTAMRRLIRQKFGDTRSIVQWWQELRPFPISNQSQSS